MYMEQSSKHSALVFLVVLLLALVGVIAYYVVNNLMPDSDGLAVMPDVTQVTEPLKGKLHLSLAPVGSTVAGLYTYDFERDEIAPLIADSALRQTSRVSPDGAKMAFLEFIPPGSLPQSPTRTYVPWMLYVQPLGQYEKRQGVFGVPFPGNSPRTPAWSPDGKSLALILSEGNQQRVNDWKIYAFSLSDQGTFGQMVENGVPGKYPTWSPLGDSIAFLREDGIYQKYRNAEPVKVLALPNNGTTTGESKIGFSPDGKRMAWTFFADQSAALNLYRVTSWAPLSLELERTIAPLRNGERFYWPVFSPDGTKLAVHRVFQAGTTEEVSEVVVYDLNSEARTVVLNLDNFDDQVTFISDWR